MWDFSKLLGSLAGEDSKGFLGGVIDPNARKRTPPKTELTPSENAIQDIASAVRDAQPVNSRNGDFGANSASSLDLVRQTAGNDQPITTDASVSSNVTNRPMDYVPVSPSDVQQGRVGTQPVVVQPQYSTPPTAQQEMPIAQAPAPASNPNAGSGNPLEDLRQQKIDLNAQPIQKQSFWKDFGTNFILGANAFFNPQNGPSPMVGWGAVKRQNENNALDRQIKPLEAVKAQQDKEAYDKARTENIYADNSTAQQRILDAKEARAERQKGMAIGRLAKMQYFDPKNAIHAQLAKEAGLNPNELEGFDWRSPHTKTVAGTTYQWSNGKFVPSDIPPDESASLVDYSVQMPDGEVQSFKVPQKDAARFATQMHVLGAQIQAADRRQDKSIAAQRETQGRIDARQAVQQKFQAQLQADRQKNGAEAADARARIALKKAGITDDEIERWLHPEKYPTLDPNDYNLNPDGFVLESKP